MKSNVGRRWHDHLIGPPVVYALTLVVVALGCLTRWLLDPALGNSGPYVIAYLAAVLTALVGGLGPGLLATGLGALACTLLFVEPRGTLWVGGTDILKLVVFLSFGMTVSLISENLHRRRQLAQHARDESERHFRGTFDNAAVGIAHIDRDGRFIRVNEKFREMLGRRCHELRGGSFTELTHPDDREADWALFSAMVRGERDSHTVEKRYLRHDGTPVWALVTRSMQLDYDGSPSYVISIVQDITDRKRAEGALRRSNAFTSQVVASSLSGLYIYDVEERSISYVSPQYTRLTGYTLEGLRSMSGDEFLELFHADDRERVVRHIAEAMYVRDDEVREIEYRFRTSDGRWIWCLSRETVFARTPDGAVWQYLGSFLDITERKRAESALEAAKRAAEEASESKDQFLAALSHELRTPLTPALAAVAMLQNQDGVDSRTRESLEIIRRNVEMEARLIDDLLDVTRIVQGKIELDTCPVLLGDVICRATEVCMPDIEARRLHFGVNLGACVAVEIDADAARLQQVFWNLLKNAIKFTPHGGCVGVRCRLEDHYVVTDVVDSGEGIEPETLAHIFKPFEQGGPSVTRQFGGLGLGLTISKGLVEMHRGEITVHSDGKGTGATFSVRLPLHVATPRALPRGTSMQGTGESSAAAGPGPERPPLKVLLVEDHGDTAMMMRLLLEEEGHLVETAGDVANALELAEAKRFDLLLSDLGLPDGSGVDLMSVLRKRGHTLPGIALTGYGREEDVSRSRAAGFAAHLTKPVSPERLLKAIADLAGQ
jgi:two-component system CheB/CheR fusion protein